MGTFFETQCRCYFIWFRLICILVIYLSMSTELPYTTAFVKPIIQQMFRKLHYYCLYFVYYMILLLTKCCISCSELLHSATFSCRINKSIKVKKEITCNQQEKNKPSPLVINYVYTFEWYFLNNK